MSRPAAGAGDGADLPVTDVDGLREAMAGVGYLTDDALGRV